MDDTTYELYTATDPSAASSGLSAGIILLYLAIMVFFVVAYWKVFTKAGKPGWASLVPIYSAVVLLRIVGRPWWWIFLLLIPFVNIIFAIMVFNDLSKSFGKGVGFTVGLVLLPLIFWPILAFGNAKYVGPAAANK